MRIRSCKAALKLLLRMLHLQQIASRVHWWQKQWSADDHLIHAYRRSFGYFCGTQMYFQLHLRTNPIGSIVSVRIARGVPILRLRAHTVDVQIFDQVFAYREFDFDVTSEPHLIIDGGAHIGCVSVFFALKFPGAVIYSIEPEAGNFALLRQNLEKYQNSVPLRAALWSRPTSLWITNVDAMSWSFEIAELDKQQSISEVLAITIGEIFTWSGAEEIDILKLDIEGSETEVLTYKSDQWMSHVQNLAIELHDRKISGCEEALRKAAGRYDFTEFTSGEHLVLQRVTAASHS